MCIINVWCSFKGAIGDVDGDGTLDLISIVSFSAEITDKFGQYVRTQKMTRVSKVNLELQLSRPMVSDFVSLNSTEPDIKQMSLMHFQSSPHQPWSAYLGAHGDSSYRLNWISFISVINWVALIVIVWCITVMFHQLCNVVYWLYYLPLLWRSTSIVWYTGMAYEYCVIL